MFLNVSLSSEMYPAAVYLAGNREMVVIRD